MINQPHAQITLYTADEWTLDHQGAPKKRNWMVKTFSITKETGSLQKGNPGIISTGTYSSHDLTLRQFKDGLPKLTEQQAVGLGTADLKEGRIGFDISKGEIRRNKDNFRYRKQPTFFLVDIDGIDLSTEDILKIISGIVPGFDDAGKLIVPSSSSGLYSADGKLLKDSSSLHIYFIIEDGTDAHRFMDVLFDRLWLTGQGFYMLSKAPSLLSRAIIDKAVAGAERIAYEAKPRLLDGITQRRPDPVLIEGGMLDTNLLLDLSDAEKAALEEIRQTEREKIQPTLEAAVSAKVERIIKERNVSKDVAEKIVRDNQAGIIDDTDLLYFAGQSKGIPAGQVLDDLGRFDKMTLAEPMEPSYDGGSLTKARLFSNLDKHKPPVIHSQAHGGITYRFRRFESKPVLENIITVNIDDLSEDMQQLRGAVLSIPKNARQLKHDAETVIGWGLRHNNSGVPGDVGATLCEEWDKKTGGNSSKVFSESDPGYSASQPVTIASIYKLAREHGWTGEAPWTDPEPLITSEKPEPYPIEALPGVIGAAVREVRDFVQSPVALIGCSALSVVSTVAQGLVDVRRTVGLEGPVSLFTLVLADSGERKSSSDSHFSKPIQQWEAERAEAARPDIKKYNADLAVWEATKSGLLSAVSTAVKKREDTDTLSFEAAALETDKPEEPKVPRLLYADSTPEALTYSLVHKWAVGSVLSSEAGIVFGGHGMSKDSAMRNMGILNALWEGGCWQIDRKGTTSYTVRNVRLSMGLAVQPETVRTFLEASKGLARGIGFLARFLIAWPESTQGTRKFKEAPETWPELSVFHRRLGALLDHPLSYDEEGYLCPTMLELSHDAKETWIAFHDDVEAELNPGRDMAEAKDVASKAADNAVRLAALFHVFENGVEGQISLEHMRAGAAIAGWHLYEARRFIRELAVDVSIINASCLNDWLVGYCKTNQVTEIGRRYLQQNCPNCTRPSEKFKSAINELVDAGRIRESKKGKQKIVEINPKLLEG